MDKRPTEWLSALMSGEYPRSNFAIEDETTVFSEFGIREAVVTCARIVKSSNGEVISDSIAPDAIPASRASETYT